MATLILTAGLTGAGKTTYLKSVGLDKMLIANSDTILEAHKDYDSKNPQLLHEWAKKENQKVIYGFLSKGVDFIIDGTGTNVERYAKYIADAKGLGYTIELHYVKVSLQTSLERNAKRERNVPTSVIYKKAGIIDQTVAAISLMCDKTIIHNND